MVLLDDSLFNLWRDNKITIEDALAKSNNPDELAKRIAKAKRGIFDDDTDDQDQTRKMGAA